MTIKETKCGSGGHHVEVDARLGWGRLNPTWKRCVWEAWRKQLGLVCHVQRRCKVWVKMEDGDKTFKKEVAILASANHPNVVKFICCGRKLEKHKCFIAMELLDTSLEDIDQREIKWWHKYTLPNSSRYGHHLTNGEGHELST